MVFYFWIRKHVRRAMKPIPIKTAEKYDRIFSQLYVLSAWSALGILLYNFIDYRRGMRQKDPSYDLKNPGFYYGRIFRAENMQIYQITNGEVIKDGNYRIADDVPDRESDNDFYGETRKKPESDSLLMARENESKA